jgi:hypothetical protein
VGGEAKRTLGPELNFFASALQPLVSRRTNAPEKELLKTASLTNVEEPEHDPRLRMCTARGLSIETDSAARPREGDHSVPVAATSPEQNTGDPIPIPASESKGSAIDAVDLTFSSVHLAGLVQGWYVGTGGQAGVFSVRRAEIKLSGKVNPGVSWTIMIDPSKTLAANNAFSTVAGTRVLADTSINPSSNVLQDAFISFDRLSYLRVDIGQFVVPLGLEGVQGAAALDTVERALFIADRERDGSYGDVRDVGVMAHGTAREVFDYSVGLFNGGSLADAIDQHAVVARLAFRPAFAPGLQVGGSSAFGVQRRDGVDRRDRRGADIAFRHGPLLLKTEVMAGTDSGRRRFGYYGHVGYTVNTRLEGIVRLDTWDPDTRSEITLATASERDVVGGVNYWWAPVRLQLNYIRKTFPGGVQPSANVARLNVQLAW